MLRSPESFPFRPVDTDSNPLTESPLSPSPHSPQSRSSSKTDYPHTSHIPTRHSSCAFPPYCPPSSASIKLPFPPSAASFEEQMRTLHDHYHASALLPPVAPFLLSPLFHWSVDDVARFIETNFFDKAIAEVNLSSQSNITFPHQPLMRVEIRRAKNRWTNIGLVDGGSSSSRVQNETRSSPTFTGIHRAFSRKNAIERESIVQARSNQTVVEVIVIQIRASRADQLNFD